MELEEAAPGPAVAAASVVPVAAWGDGGLTEGAAREVAASSNLRRIYCIWLLFRLMETVSYGPFFDAYLSELDGGGATFVGAVETVSSLTQVVVALPLGALADRHRRDRLMRGNALLGVVAGCCYWPAMLSGARGPLFLAVVTYAVYSRSYGGTMDMMIADIVTPDTATHVAMRKTQLGTLGVALGPALQLLLLVLGTFDVGASGSGGSGGDGALEASSGWNTSELRWLVLSGWLAFPFIAPVQCSFKHLAPHRPAACSNGTSSANSSPVVGAAAAAAAPLLPAAEGERSDAQVQPATAAATGLAKVPAAIAPGAGGAAGAAPSPDQSPVPASSMPGSDERWWLVPVLLEGFRVLSLLCAGMTTRYFALLFKNFFGMSPAGVAILFALSPLVQTAALQSIPLITKRLGRPLAALLLHLLSVTALLVLAASPGPAYGVAGFLTYQAMVKMLDIPIYSIVLETVKPEHRGKFFHLLSIKPLSFGASALLGGYLADNYGYRVTVAATGLSLLVVATPLLVVTVWLAVGRR